MRDAVPLLPAHLAECWGVADQELIADTMTSHVYRVRLSDGAQAVAKILKPAGLHERAGICLLEWRGGMGAVRLIDRQDTACLMEDAGTLSLAEFRRQHGEAAANAVIIDVVRGLLSANHQPAPPELVPLKRHFRALFEQAAKPDGSELSGLLKSCATIADVLIGTQVDPRPLHGDLHHDNIVTGGARGWLAIDPHGVIGDPAYEVANIFGNPRGAALDEPGLIAARIRSFSDAIGCSGDKILRFAIAQAGLSLNWSLEDGESFETDSHIHQRIAFLRAAIRLLEGRPIGAS